MIYGLTHSKQFISFFPDEGDAGDVRSSLLTAGFVGLVSAVVPSYPAPSKVNIVDGVATHRMKSGLKSGLKSG